MESITVGTSGYTGRGGQKENEDSMAVWEDGDHVCAVVADGLGGHGGGKTASDAAVKTVGEYFERSPAMGREEIREMFEAANSAVLALQSPQCRMKTTAAVLLLNGNRAAWAHIGDSRLYHFTDGRLVYQTLDHSVSQMAVFTGEITREQIRFHEDRNRVLRALGAGVNPIPEITGPAELADGFHAFLLCTDGFWEYVLEAEMEIELSKSETAAGWVSNLICRLNRNVEKMEMKDKNDNYTVCAVFINCPCTDRAAGMDQEGGEETVRTEVMEGRRGR